jgi:hypothetical protein
MFLDINVRSDSVQQKEKAPWTFQSRTPRQPSPRTAKPRNGYYRHHHFV